MSIYNEEKKLKKVRQFRLYQDVSQKIQPQSLDLTTITRLYLLYAPDIGI